ncbi:phycobiliprotein lyase [Acidithiobacillus ferrivorans]|uniref:phycobiliprotein lyase n=1 Tax=Acidithiobacillus ferrivorans TaxID=160808 RepID=UPI001C06FB3F|nr:phycobiliprotein lyase [Acidithiobacillus ferrivorans]MBU2849586.1 hypothetical protein [Acidithiobacillus ferrivorans]
MQKICADPVRGDYLLRERGNWDARPVVAEYRYHADEQSPGSAMAPPPAPRSDLPLGNRHARF